MTLESEIDYEECSFGFTKLEALERSAKKWEKICNSEDTISYVTQQCALCSVFHCSECPLSLINEGCGNVNSTWAKIARQYCTNINIWCKTVSEIKNKTLTKLCNKMLNILRELYQQELNKQNPSQNETLNKQENEMERTLKQLTDSEKNMARTLVYDMYANGAAYTEEDVAKALNITKRTVAALKAHVTMSELYR